MLPFPHICLNKKNKLNLSAFTPLEAGHRRRPTAAFGSLPLTGFTPLETRQKRRPTVASGNLFLTGFTLVELLIAVSIFSVVSIAIYSTFSSGASVLRRVKNIDFTQQMLLLKTEKFSRELRELPDCRKQLFSGARTRISFPGNVDYLPCRVTYYFDSSSFCFMRVVDKLSQIITPEGKVDARFKSAPVVFLSKIKEVKFSYLNFDLIKNEYNWIEEWPQDYLPAAVKLTITSQTQEYVFTIFLPKV